MLNLFDSQRIKVTNWHGRPRYVFQYCILAVNNVSALGDYPLCYELLMKSCLMQRGFVIPSAIINKSLLRHPSGSHSSVLVFTNIHIMYTHIYVHLRTNLHITLEESQDCPVKIVVSCACTIINNQRQLRTCSQPLPAAL